jgi:hypothetical protein
VVCLLSLVPFRKRSFCPGRPCITLVLLHGLCSVIEMLCKPLLFILLLLLLLLLPFIVKLLLLRQAI